MPASVIASPPKGLSTATELLKISSGRRAAWRLDALAGRYVQVAGGPASAALTAVRNIVLEAQQDGGLAAWVGRRSSVFFPPDFAAAGVDVNALPVVFTEDVKSAYRALDILLRSGAFTVIVLDLGIPDGIPLAVQTRIAGLAKEHQIAVLELARNDRSQTSRSSLASLRVETTKEHAGTAFVVAIHALKDKRSSPGWTQTEPSHGPDGMC